MAYWAATRCLPRRERTAEKFLQQAGFEVYLPQIRERKLLRGRRVQMLSPLFPGYCFTRIELQWHAARWCPGVVNLVRNADGLPAHVPDEIIADIRKREKRGVVELPQLARFKVGDQVQVISGAFSGRHGLFASMAAQDRVAVLLEMMGAQRQVQLPHDAVEAVQCRGCGDTSGQATSPATRKSIRTSCSPRSNGSAC
jgi:transcriptional antiterminator RfaH